MADTGSDFMAYWNGEAGIPTGPQWVNVTGQKMRVPFNVGPSDDPAFVAKWWKSQQPDDGGAEFKGGTFA